MSLDEHEVNVSVEALCGSASSRPPSPPRPWSMADSPWPYVDARFHPPLRELEAAWKRGRFIHIAPARPLL